MSSIFRSMRISATALTSERLRIDVISNNIANSQTAAAKSGAYKRKRVVFQAQEEGRSPLQRIQRSGDMAEVYGLQGVRVRSIKKTKKA